MEPIYSNYSPTFLYVDKYRFPQEWMPEIYKAYTKQVSSRRFTISV